MITSVKLMLSYATLMNVYFFNPLVCPSTVRGPYLPFRASEAVQSADSEP